MSRQRPLRAISQNGGETAPAQGGRTDSQGYIHGVRPDSSSSSHRPSLYRPLRTTLCSVMAQLKEETQPLFESTLKSKAVSEACDVTFTCVVTGHPQPELTWYKDDIEMDRYCGLPKYEIFRNGKTHSLHIYNCTLEDAAIYQVSARNSKGIVSCSGVLEVGTMNEYQIHQRFFAKLKQKAESKRKELEQGRRRGPVDQHHIAEQQNPVTRDASQRKLWFTGELVGEDKLKVKVEAQQAEDTISRRSQEAGEPEGVMKIANGIPAGNASSLEEAVEEQSKEPLTSIYDTVERISTKDPRKEPPGKVITVCNGMDSGNGSSISESKSSHDGGVSLAEYMTESLCSQVSEGKAADKTTAMCSSGDEDQYLAEEAKRTEVLVTGTTLEAEATKKSLSSISQSPLTSMLFSLRDIFFGGSNKKGGEVEEKLSHLDLTRFEKKEEGDTGEEVTVMEIHDHLLSEDICGQNTQSPAFGPTQELHEDLLEWDNVTPEGHGQGITEIRDTEFVTQAEGWETKERTSTELTEDKMCNSPESPAVAPPMAPCDVDQDESVEQDGALPSLTLDVEISAEDRADVDANEAQVWQDWTSVDVAQRKCSESENTESLLMSSTESKSETEGESEMQECVGAKESRGYTVIGVTEEEEEKEEEETMFSHLQPDEPKRTLELPSVEKSATPSSTQTLASVELTHLDDPQLPEDVKTVTRVTEPEGKLKETSLEPSSTEFILPDMNEEDWRLKTHSMLLQVNDGDKQLSEKTSVTERASVVLSLVQPAVITEPLISESHPAVITDTSLVLHHRRETVSSPSPTETGEMTYSHKEAKMGLSKVAETSSECTREAEGHGHLGKPDGAASSEAAFRTTPTLGVTRKVPRNSDCPLSITHEGETAVNELPFKEDAIKSTSFFSLLREVKSNLDTERTCEEETRPLQYQLDGNQETKESKNLHSGKVAAEILVPKRTGSPHTSLGVPDMLLNSVPLLSVTEADSDGQTSGHSVDCLSVGPTPEDQPVADMCHPTNPQLQSLSPTLKRRFSAKGICLDSQGSTSIPVIQLEGTIPLGRTGEEQSWKNTAPGMDSSEGSPRLKRTSSLGLIPSATPEELASGARRKIFIPKAKGEEAENTMTEPQVRRAEIPRRSRSSLEQDTACSSPGQTLGPSVLQTPPAERRSPLATRRKAVLEVPMQQERASETRGVESGTKSTGKEKTNLFKAPQVIRKIRGEPFADAPGHLKLWCQFFNVLSDSIIKWYRDEAEITEITRRSGDESRVALAIVQVSSRDCGVYSCSIKNEYGTDSTDFLLSVDVLSEFLLREDLGVGEEVEMTPMVFSKGLADPGYWGDKFFGRIMIEETHLGEGCTRKACRAKVIYGLEPVFESGSNCIIKVRSPIAYGTREESSLNEQNLETTKEDCKVQNTTREYCKIFAAEARMIEGFGPALEIIPLYLIYRPANAVPYGTVEAHLKGVFLRYSLMDAAGQLILRNMSVAEQKCCAFQHWIHQWTNGNLLPTRLEGVDLKITNIGLATKSQGYQGFSGSAKPHVFQQFITQHQCNHYCTLLGLRSFKTADSLQPPTKPKGSRSPQLGRKLGPGSSSPQLQRKGVASPQTARKASSPKVVRKSESGEPTAKHKTVEPPKIVRMR